MTHIALIGPIGVGKSTIAPLVGRLTGRPVIELDELRPDFYRTLDYDNDEADREFARHGVDGLLRYWKPFEIALVEHAVTLEPEAILDFGAGHSHYDDAAQRARAGAALAPHYVVLLLPSLDPAESERALATRQPDEFSADARRLNAVFVSSESNRALADRVVITGDRSPDEVAEDLALGWAAHRLIR